MKPIVFLTTNDSAVETTVTAVAKSADCQLSCAKTTKEAVRMLAGEDADHSTSKKLVVVDLDISGGSRTLLRTAGGMLPVIAVTSKDSPWLVSLKRHHRVGATLVKPVQPDELRRAFRNVGNISSQTSTVEDRWPQLKAAIHRVRCVLGTEDRSRI